MSVLVPPKSLTRRPELQALTGIRAVAAMWVVFYHMLGKLEEAFPRQQDLIRFLFGHGYLGVDLFFLLSGFIIFYNYRDLFEKVSAKNYLYFLYMRLARIWPVHIAILIAFVILLATSRVAGLDSAQNDKLYTIPKLLASVLLVQAWSVPIQDSWNVPAWSISCEWLVYLLFPFVCANSRHLQKLSLRPIWIAGSLLSLLVILLHKLHADGAARFGLIRVIFEFFAGGALFSVFRSKTCKQLPWNVITPICFFVILASPEILMRAKLTPYCILPVLGLLILSLAHESGVISRLLRSKVMQIGGVISYSIYMVHELSFIGARFLIQRNDWLEANGIGRVLIILIYLVFVLGPALALFHIVEKPWRRRMRDLLSKGKPVETS